MKEKNIDIKIGAQKIAGSYFITIIFLLVIHIAGLILYFNFDGYKILDITDWFDLAQENNIPSYYSGFALFSCSFFLFIITFSKKTTPPPACKAYWLFLSILFVYLSLDEILAIHENIGTFIEQFFEAKGFLYFLWVIPYSLLLLVFILIYLKFLINLPRKFQFLFILSGFIFVSGAIGFEVFSAKEADLHGYDSLKYCVLYTCEEFLEMAGIVLFLYALLLYIKDEIEYLSVYKKRKIFFS